MPPNKQSEITEFVTLQLTSLIRWLYLVQLIFFSVSHETMMSYGNNPTSIKPDRLVLSGSEI